MYWTNKTHYWRERAAVAESELARITRGFGDATELYRELYDLKRRLAIAEANVRFSDDALKSTIADLRRVRDNLPDEVQRLSAELHRYQEGYRSALTTIGRQSEELICLRNLDRKLVELDRQNWILRNRLSGDD